MQADALVALGKTRDERAFEALASRTAVPSWNDVVAAGALRGLGKLADERAIPILIDALSVNRSENVRRAALDGLANAGNLLDRSRTEIVDAILPIFDDAGYFVRRSAIAAAATLRDGRFLSILDRAESSEVDGSLRRGAFEAMRTIREAQKTPPEIATLREELDRMREEQRALRERLDTVSR